MASKICATLLPIVLLPLGVLGVPLGEHGVPLGILAAGRERQGLLQEKVCYYQVLQSDQKLSQLLSGGKDPLITFSLLVLAAYPIPCIPHIYSVLAASLVLTGLPLHDGHLLTHRLSCQVCL